jgi:hypothetical protein
MGLLDDAIREHLDLKRRRGADPSEIAKEEAEALGPVRRDAPVEDEDPLPPGPVADDHEPPALDEPAVVYDDEPAFDDDEDDDRLVPSEPPATHDHIWAEPEEESPTPPHGDPLAHQQTREFSATELGEALGHDDAPTPPVAPEPSEDDEAEDELEETPDFLQETPEHDRLWFEQKPPRDFDFDK